MGIADLLDQLDIKEPLPSYSPTLHRITGGKGEAVALSQLIYKCGKGNWGTVRMSSTDWANELQLTRREFENLNDCITTLSLGTIEIVNIGYVKKLAYTLNKEAIIEALKDSNVTYSVRNKLRIDTSEVTHIKDIKSNKTKEDNKEPLTETSSVVSDGLIKSDFLKDEIAERTERNKAAAPKTKKVKEPTDELTAEIHKYVMQSSDFFIDWFKDKYATPPNIQTKDIVNLKKTFRSVMAKDQNLTPERCFKGVQYFIANFEKFDNYTKKKFSINHIATNWDELVKAVKDYKPPVERKNFNEPVAFVPAVKEKIEYYNTMPLPVGLTDDAFRELGEAIYREKIMDGEVDPKEIGISQFTEIIYKQVRAINQQQLQDLLDTYGIV
jgi:hypothetical protein